MVEFGPKLDGIRGLYLVKLRGAIDKLHKGVLLITILDQVMYMSQSIYNISQYINWRISIWLVHKLTDIIQ